MPAPPARFDTTRLFAIFAELRVGQLVVALLLHGQHGLTEGLVGLPELGRIRFRLQAGADSCGVTADPAATAAVE